MIDHCSRHRLQTALSGVLPAADELALHRHLEECPSCSAELERLSGEHEIDRKLDQEIVETLRAELDTPEDATTVEMTTIDFSVEHLEPSDDPDAIGRLGEYDIHKIIGRGGMGIVLKALDRELKRFVAIKVLAPNLAVNASARKRFAREAQAAAAVVDVNVMAIHRVQTNGRLPYLVMPLLSGESLADRLKRRGPLSISEAMRVGLQSASGLAAAHRQGLIHRDVKPANILLEAGTERTVISDFGLARTADDVSLTRYGVIAGTPEYMSPEQVRGDRIDARSDLFSLGVTLFEAVSGVSPFRADTTIATLKRIVDETHISLEVLVPDLPRWFTGIVDKLLSKNPNDRFSSSAELKEILEACLSHLQHPGTHSLPQAAIELANAPAKATLLPKRSLSDLFMSRRSIVIGAALLACGLYLASWIGSTPTVSPERYSSLASTEGSKESSDIEFQPIQSDDGSNRRIARISPVFVAGKLDPLATERQLRNTISRAESGDIIELHQGPFTLSGLSRTGEPMMPDADHGDLDIYANLTIRGVSDSPEKQVLLCVDPNVQRDQRDRVLEVHPGVSLALENLRIENGVTRDFGGGIKSHGELCLVNVSVNNNRVIAPDGAEGSGATQIAGGNGSPAMGGGVYQVGGSLKLERASIERNEVLGGQGGAGGSGVGILSGNHQHATAGGAGGTALGGGIYLHEASLFVSSDTSIKKNRAIGGTGGCGGHGADGDQSFAAGTNGGDSGLGGDALGGGIYFDSADIASSEIVFSSNSSDERVTRIIEANRAYAGASRPAGNGGAGYGSGSGGLAGNGGDGGRAAGGGIFALGKLTLNDAVFVGNSVNEADELYGKGGDGGRGGNGGNGVADASPNGGDGHDGGTNGRGGLVEGGAVYAASERSFFTLSRCRFVENHVTSGSNGRVGSGGNGGIVSLIKSKTLGRNGSGGNAGYPSAWNNGPQTHAGGYTPETARGGALFLSASMSETSLLTGNEFVANSAAGGNGANGERFVGNAPKGGETYSHQNDEATLPGNYSPKTPVLDGPHPQEPNRLIALSGGTAAGGGMFIETGRFELSGQREGLTGVRFAGNHVSGGTGGDGASPGDYFYDQTLEGMLDQVGLPGQPGGRGGHAQGGGLFIGGGEISIVDYTFTDNRSTAGAGGEGGIGGGNSGEAKSGEGGVGGTGGTAFGGAICVRAGVLSINRCTLSLNADATSDDSGNAAIAGNGGRGGDAGRSHTGINSGSAGDGGEGGFGVGGAIAAVGKSQVSIVNSTLVGNRCTSSRGGVSGVLGIPGKNGLPRGGMGAGIFQKSTNECSTINVTIADNRLERPDETTPSVGSGPGIHNAFGVFRIGNTLVARNAHAKDLERSELIGDGFVSNGRNIVERLEGCSGFTSSDMTGTSTRPLKNIHLSSRLETNPLHGREHPITSTLRLLSGSCATDAGENSAIPEISDQRGPSYLRHYGTIDIGAFEHQPGES